MRKLSTTTLAVLVSAGCALVAAVVILLVVVLGADDPSGKDGGNASSSAPTDGCSETTTQELYVQRVYDCPDGTRVLTFATTDARNSYLEVAESFGQATVERGATWARVRV